MIFKKWTYFTILFFILSSILIPAAGNNYTYKLENGLTVILEPNQNASITAYSIIVAVGSRNETAGMFGASHMLEHLIFNGTSTRTQEQIYSKIDSIGAYSNASTNIADTTYLMLVPSEKAKEGLELISDMLLNSIIDPAKFTKERGIIYEEINKSYVQPYYMIENLYASLITNTPGYSHPVLGEKEDIKNMSRDKILEYYKKYYIPSNMILRVVGNFHENEIKTWIDKYFGAPNPVKEIPGCPVFSLNDIDNSLKSSTISKSRGETVILSFPAPGIRSADYPAYLIFSEILDNRLKNIFKPNSDEMIFRLTTEYIPYEENGIFKVSMTTAPVKDQRNFILTALAYISNQGIENIKESEIEAAKVAYLNNLKVMNEKPHIDPFIRGHLYAVGGPDIFSKTIKMIDYVRYEDIQKIRQNYFGNPLFKAFLVTGRNFDRNPVFKAEEIKQKSIEFLEDNFHQDLNIPSIPAESYKPVKTSRLVDKVLANGLRIGIIQSPDSEVFAIHLLIKNRSYLEPKEKKGVASLLQRLLLSGTSRMNKFQIQGIANAIGLKITTNDNPMIPYDDMYIDPTFSFIKLETTNEFAKPALSFLYNIMYHTSLTKEQVDEAKSEQISNIKMFNSDPRTLGKIRFMQLLLGPDHALAVPHLGTEPAVSSITSNDLIDFRKTYFAPDNIIMTITTNRDADTILNVINQIFGVESIRYTPAEIKAYNSVEQQDSGVERIDLNARQSYLYYGYLFNYKKEQRAALELAAQLISDDLSYQIREVDGLAYSLGASIDFYRYNALFVFQIGTSRENLDRVIEKINAGLEKFETYDLSAAATDKLKNQYLGKVGRRSYPSINKAYNAGLGLFLKSSMTYFDELTDSVRAITTEDISDALDILLEDRDPLILKID